jgi:hypothetical protein
VARGAVGAAGPVPQEAEAVEAVAVVQPLPSLLDPI